MKNSDIALVILIAVLSFGIAYFVMGLIMVNPSKRVEEIEYIQDIAATIEEPDHETFNAYASNLNEEITVGKCSEYDAEYVDGSCVSKDKKTDDDEDSEEDDTEDTEE